MHLAGAERHRDAAMHLRHALEDRQRPAGREYVDLAWAGMLAADEFDDAKTIIGLAALVARLG